MRTKTGVTAPGSPIALADHQRKVRAELVTRRTAEAKAFASLRVEKAGIELMPILVRYAT